MNESNLSGTREAEMWGEKLKHLKSCSSLTLAFGFTT